MARVTLFDGPVDELLHGPSGPVYKDILRRTLNVHSRAVRTAPVKTARLKNSLRWRMGRDVQGIFGLVGTDVDYFLFVHGGTRPHIIRPKRKKALYWSGALHPVRKVHHPGTKANRFLLEALKAANP